MRFNRAVSALAIVKPGGDFAVRMDVLVEESGFKENQTIEKKYIGKISHVAI